MDGIMKINRLYEIARVRRNEFYSAKPDNIEKADIYPIVHNDTNGHIFGRIEVSLNTGSAFASYNLLEITRYYIDEQGCEKVKEEVIAYLTDYFEKTFCEDEIKHFWQYVDSGNLQWHQYTRYTIPYSSYIEDIYGLYDTIKMCELALLLTKPEEVENIKLIPYFEDLGYYKEDENDNDTSATLLISVDVRIEKKEEYAQFVWTGTADGYSESRSREEAEEYLVGELLDILNGTLLDEEIQNFWEEVPWNKDWKKIETHKQA